MCFLLTRSVLKACGVRRTLFQIHDLVMFHFENWTTLFHFQAFLIRLQPWCHHSRSFRAKPSCWGLFPRSNIFPPFSLQSLKRGSKGSDCEGKSIVWEYSVQKYYHHLLKALFMSPQSLFLFPRADRCVQTNQATCRQRGQSQSVHLPDPETLLSGGWQKKTLWALILADIWLLYSSQRQSTIYDSSATRMTISKPSV